MMRRTEPEIRSIVERILHRHLPGFCTFEDEGTAKSSALGLDSLRAVGIILQIEQAFGSPVPDDSLDGEVFDTPLSILAFVISAYSGIPHQAGKE